MSLYYMSFNPYGSETSVGFDNTLEVRVFFSRKERDQAVSLWANHNLSVRPLSRKEACKLVPVRPDGKREWRLGGDRTNQGFVVR